MPDNNILSAQAYELAETAFATAIDDAHKLNSSAPSLAPSLGVAIAALLSVNEVFKTLDAEIPGGEYTRGLISGLFHHTRKQVTDAIKSLQKATANA